MSDRQQLLLEATELLHREGLYLDEQRFDEWLALFTDDCEYHVPSWISEHAHTTDPKRELSLIYYKTRGGLEDRVWRVKSGLSVASTPIPRTCHLVSNILLDEASDAAMQVTSAWTVHCYYHKPKENRVFFGHSRHHLVATDDGWKIARKRVILRNDYIPTMLDFFNI